MNFSRCPYLLPVMVLCSACVLPGARFDHIANRTGMERSTIDGSGFTHRVYVNGAAHSVDRSKQDLWVFIEGDGSPIEFDSLALTVHPARDPIARNPIGLRLAAATPASALYLSRPCYGDATTEPRCASSLWTSARYSTPVVDSMAAALSAYQRQHGWRSLILVGYSGGGVLAVLMADRVAAVRAVITISANLDIDAWARDSSCRPLADRSPATTGGCEPFVNSVNPADSIRQRHWTEIALIAGKDTVVPSHTTVNYFAHHPETSIWEYPEFDHGCCWVEQWPQIFHRLATTLATRD